MSENFKAGDKIYCCSQNEMIFIADRLFNSGFNLTIYFDGNIIEIQPEPIKAIEKDGAIK